MLFGTSNSLKKYEHFKKVNIGMTTIKITKKVKGLGFHIDNELKMEDQIKNIIRTCYLSSKNIAFI